MPCKPSPPLGRILSKIVKDEITGCWNFTGALILSRGGGLYGVIGEKYKHWLVHRYMYWYHFLKDKGEELDKKICVCHTCDNTRCCNPEHLFLGTNKDNSQDASRKGRLSHGENHQWSKLTEQQVLEIFRMKGTLKEIGNRYGVNPHAVLDIKTKRTWKGLTKDEVPVIENHGTRLTKEQVLEIYPSSSTSKVLGEKYGVSPSTIVAIKAGITWSWLTEGIK
jgi:hypothetical protein